MIKKLISSISSFIAFLLLVGTVYGGDVTDSIFVKNLIITSDVSYLVTQEVDSADIATQAMFDAGYISSTSMDMELHEASTDVPFMPGTMNLDVLYAWSGVPSDETLKSNDAISNDMDLPSVVAEFYEFSFDHASKYLKLNISTAGAGTAVIDWEFYDGATWQSLSNVVDNTSNFEVSGTNSVSWDIPTSWIRSTLHATQTGFWVRATMSGGTTSVAPQGAQAWYETGRLFYYVDSIASVDQLNYDLYLSTSPLYGGVRTYHNYFPGFEGIVKTDDADIELVGNWRWDIKNALRVDKTELGSIISKNNSMSLDYISAATVGGNNTLTFSTVGSDFYGEWTHSEEGTGGYYSGAGIESYSKSLYNAASNYITSHREDVADIVSNTSSEVLTTKVGMAYDKTIDTTPAFGAKIDDPT